ncbi:MAG: LPS assembly lipoprotein LptE [Pseudomonadota bacterium]
MNFAFKHILLLMLVILGGCGFQLAAPPDLPGGLDRVAIEAEDTRSELYIALERALLDRGIGIDPRAPTRIVLSVVETGQRVLSVSARNIPREYEVFYTVAFSFTRDGALKFESDPLTLTRDYQWSEFEVLGKEREAADLRALIVQDLVDTILRQIASRG